MKFIRRRSDSIDLDALRHRAARDGWLVEDPSILRAGIGPRAIVIELGGGLRDPSDVLDTLREHTLLGDGPVGSGIVAFGSLPFDRSASAQLIVPAHVITYEKGGEFWVSSAEGFPPLEEYLRDIDAPLQETQSPRTIAYRPTPEEYAHNVALAVELLRRKEINKVVLARAVAGTVPEPIDPAAVIERLRRREPKCTLYSLPTPDGRRFIGASPELLVRRVATTITCHPLAGTISLPPNVAPDDYQNWLLGSSKNLHEHAVLVDEIVTNLAEHYDSVVSDPTPSIVALRTVAHLGTWVTASCENEVDAPDALEALRFLHPTAAVGGIPREDAYQLIKRLEQDDRGHYAGPLGWMDARGDGEWWVGIRGVLVDGNAFEAWAGAGIVSESDPIAEREETRDKLASVLTSVLAERV